VHRIHRKGRAGHQRLEQRALVLEVEVHRAAVSRQALGLQLGALRRSATPMTPKERVNAAPRRGPAVRTGRSLHPNRNA
jgi:hypothetical protein